MKEEACGNFFKHDFEKKEEIETGRFLSGRKEKENLGRQKILPRFSFSYVYNGFIKALFLSFGNGENLAGIDHIRIGDLGICLPECL